MLTGIGTFLTASAVYLGFRNWYTQRSYTEQSEVAKRLLITIYKSKFVFARLRSEMSKSEVEATEKRLKSSEGDFGSNFDYRYAAFEGRNMKEDEYWKELQNLIPEVYGLLGKDAADLLEQIIDLQQQFNEASYKLATGGIQGEERELLHSILIRKSSPREFDTEDFFDNKIKKLISDAEKFRPKPLWYYFIR